MSVFVHHSARGNRVLVFISERNQLYQLNVKYVKIKHVSHVVSPLNVPCGVSDY